MSEIGDFIRKKTANKLPHSVHRKFEILRKNPIRPRAKTLFENGNTYVDRLLLRLTKQESGFDPYPLSDIKPNLSDFSSISSYCKLQLKRGLLTGLRDLHRAGYCCLREIDGRMHVNADLGAGPLFFTYEGSIGFMCFRRNFIFNACFSYATMLVHFSVDASTGKDVQLHKVYLEKLAEPCGYIEGLWPFTRGINSAISKYLEFSENKVQMYLSSVVQDHLQKVFAQYQFPSKKALFCASSLSRPPAANIPLHMGNLFAIEEESD